MPERTSKSVFQALMRTRLGFVIEFGRPDSIITTTKNLVKLFARKSGLDSVLAFPSILSPWLVSGVVFPQTGDSVFNPQRMLASSLVFAVGPFIGFKNK